MEIIIRSPDHIQFEHSQCQVSTVRSSQCRTGIRGGEDRAKHETVNQVQLQVVHARQHDTPDQQTNDECRNECAQKGKDEDRASIGEKVVLTIVMIKYVMV
jgi:hypothetical protein